MADKSKGIVQDDGSEPDIWYVPGAGAAGWLIAMADRPSKVFRSLWSSLHGEDSWAANPYVVAVTFRPILANIDGLTKEEPTRVTDGSVNQPALSSHDPTKSATR